MKSRLPSYLALTNKQKQAVRAAAADALDKERADQMRRFFKLACFVLNRRYGFGKSRLLVTVDEIGKIAAEHEKDEEFWHHLDNVIVDEIGIDFPRENM